MRECTGLSLWRGFLLQKAGFKLPCRTIAAHLPLSRFKTCFVVVPVLPPRAAPLPRCCRRGCKQHLRNRLFLTTYVCACKNDGFSLNCRSSQKEEEI